MRHEVTRCVLLLLAAAVGLGGCASGPPLPTYPWAGPDHALAVLSDRAQQIHGISAQCTIMVQTPKHDSITLDGAMAARQPDRFRVQAWKFDQNVMDLTLRDGHAWLWLDPRAADAADYLKRTSGRTPWLGPLMQQLNSASAKVIDDGAAGGVLIVSWPLEAVMPPGSDDAASLRGWSLIMRVDRPTLTIRELSVSDPQGRIVQRIKLDHYTLLSPQGIAWPLRIQASGRVNMTLRLSDVELNPDLPDAAFTPSPQATQLH